MNSVPRFQPGEVVFLVQDITSFFVLELPGTVMDNVQRLTVTDPYVPTDMKRINGEPVHFYVRLSNKGLYHQCNCIRPEEYDPGHTYKSI